MPAQGLPGPHVAIAAFLLLALPLCLTFALRMPLGEIADEPAHLMRAASLLDGQWLGHRETIPGPDGATAIAAGVTVDPVWEAMSRVRDPEQVSRLADPAPEPWLGHGGWDAPARFFPLYTIATYCPVFYLPAALGLATGRVAGLDPRGAAVAGRLAVVLAYAGLAVLALGLARRGRGLLLCGLALPMSLALAGSFNQDGLIIATASLAVALVTRAWTAATMPAQRRSRGAAAVLIGLIVLAKPPYAPLAAVLLVPVPHDAPAAALMRRVAGAALALLPGLAWAAFAAAFVATPVPRPAYAAGPLWPGPRPAIFRATDPGAQVAVLAAAPTRLVTLPARFLSTIKHLVRLAREAVGVLGWADRPIPLPVHAAWLVALAATAIAQRGRAPDVRAPDLRAIDLAVVAVGALACLWAVLLSQYVTWTNVGADRIDGPQGRYLLPILPMIVPWLPKPDGPASRWRHALALLPCAAAAAGLVVIPPAT